MRPYARLCVSLTIVLFANGCGSSEPAASGTVRVDDKPLLAGSISFFPLGDTPGSGGGTTVVDGEYRVSRGLSVGKYRVEIQGTRRDTTRRTPEPFGTGLIPAEVPVVPPQYNLNSELVRTLEVGENVFDFDLTGFRDQ